MGKGEMSGINKGLAIKALASKNWFARLTTCHRPKIPELILFKKKSDSNG